MKRIRNIYPDIYNINHLKEVYKEVRNGCNNIKGLYRFELFLSSNLFSIAKLLNNKKYTFSNYHIFLIKEPKYRLIMSENIPDKIVNHMISRYLLLPAIESKLIDTNVATRKLKGSDYAYKMLNKYFRKLLLSGKDIYILKIDIKKYFYNIDHNILKEKLSRIIKDQDALRLIMLSLNTTNESYINDIILRIKNNEINKIIKLNISAEEKARKISEIVKIPLYKKNKGLGIGNMTSQILAVYYLNDVDHFIKEKLKCKYYIRYMDDLIILDNNEKKLKSFLPLIENEIKKINLEINEKSRIINLKRGLSFLGYTYLLKDNIIIKINNNTMKRIKKHLKQLKTYDTSKYQLSLVSYKGFFIRASYYSSDYRYN